MLTIERIGALIAVAIVSATVHPQVVLKPANASGVKLRLRRLTARATVRNGFASVSYLYTYTNPIKSETEADFIFTAPNRTLITGFSYWANDERVPAMIVERSRASQIYRTITAPRRDPALLELVGKRTFRTRISPLLPGVDLKVQIDCVVALSRQANGQASLTIPIQRPPGEILERLNVSVDADSPNLNNYGLSRGLKPTYAADSIRPTRDLTLRFSNPQNPLNATLQYGRSGGSDGFFALSLPAGKGNAQVTGLRLSGLTTYGLFRPAWTDRRGGEVIVGRYRGKGILTVTRDGQRVQLPVSDRRDPNGAAVKLWAQAKLDSLGKNEAQRAQIVALSNRFGLPSVFTSWLAIPKAEREAFLEEIKRTRVFGLAREYAELRSRGRAKEASKVAEEIIRTSPRTFRPSDAVTEAVREMLLAATGDAVARTAVGKRDPAYEAAIRRWSHAVGYPDNALREEAQNQASSLANAWTSQFQNRGQAAALLTRLNRLGVYGVNTLEIRRSASGGVVDEAAIDVGRALRSGKGPDSEQVNRLNELSRSLNYSYATLVRRGKQLAIRRELYDHRTALSRQMQATGPDANKEKQIARLVREEAALGPIDTFGQAPPEMYQLAANIADAVSKGEEARSMRTQYRRLGAALQLPTQLILRESVQALLDSVWWEYQEKVDEVRPDRAKVYGLLTQINRLKQDGGDLKVSRGRVGIAPDSERAVRRQLIAELRKPNSDRNHVAELNRKMARRREIENGGQRPGYAQLRLERLEAEVALDQLSQEARTPAVENEIRRLEAKSKEIRARMGDPLAVYEGHGNARTVVAIMPDGSVLPMRWVASRFRWEARFDIPHSAKAGAYQIRIVAVFADLRRDVRTQTFHVDLTPPTGVARQGPGGVLTISASPDTARAEARVGGRRVELAPTGIPGGFIGRVPPDQALRVILTDRAHNRNVIRVGR